MLKLFYQPNPGPHTVGSSMWSETHPGDGWEQTTPEAYQQWLSARPPLPAPPPPPPPPDWLGFAGWLFRFPPMAEAMNAARASTSDQGEPATTALPAAMQEARLNQNYPAWAATWGQFLLASAMSANTLTDIIGKAAECNLPTEFIVALQPQQPGGQG